MKRIVCVQDMGMVVNPRGAKFQMEGAIIMGLGYSLKEMMHFKNGQLVPRPRRFVASWRSGRFGETLLQSDAAGRGGRRSRSSATAPTDNDSQTQKTKPDGDKPTRSRH